MNLLFRAYFRQKKFPEETWLKTYLGLDPDQPYPDPDVFKCRVRIRSKIVRIRNTARDTGHIVKAVGTT
jgi:hypothetical protein